MGSKRSEMILVVDDELGIRQSFNMILKDDYKIILASTGNEALELFKANPVDIVLLDILLPDMGGLELLEKFKETDPTVEVIMVTAVKEVAIAVKAIKSGAYEYIMKPFTIDDILSVIQRALEKRSLIKEVAYLRNELEVRRPFEMMVGEDPKMREIFDYITIIAQSSGTVLIQGESGTGKELVARAIHNRSPRKSEPFIVMNCAAIPITLMESEIFGYNKGAFTGAFSTRIGKLEMANKGTVFLDDVDSMDVKMQGKLLRIIQDKEFERLGSSKVLKADVRFIAASNKDLKTLIEQSEFREDLFYRLNVFPIKVPPLRERKKDVPLLLEHFTALYAKQTGKEKKQFSEDAVRMLTVEYEWPGNVRELQNLVERLITITKDPVIRSKDLPSVGPRKAEIRDMTLKEAVNTFERQYIAEVLETVGGNKSKAAEKLGIHRNTLLSKTNEPDSNS
ncbi:MAG TPA: sigma-54 dependent transcriptional regulator [Thermodesulfobacteriota bacterium]|nr:sigma-54 dependent transcriptional regulator [Thermodesulfobacteriota bacterium]